MERVKKQKTPATAVAVGAAGGGGIGFFVSWALAAAGVEVPPGGESAITSAIGLLFAYFAPGGRKGDPR